MEPLLAQSFLQEVVLCLNHSMSSISVTASWARAKIRNKMFWILRKLEIKCSCHVVHHPWLVEKTNLLKRCEKCIPVNENTSMHKVPKLERLRTNLMREVSRYNLLLLSHMWQTLLSSGLQLIQRLVLFLQDLLVKSKSKYVLAAITPSYLLLNHSMSYVSNEWFQVKT